MTNVLELLLSLLFAVLAAAGLNAGSAEPAPSAPIVVESSPAIVERAPIVEPAPLAPCEQEDGANCVWNGQTMGNGQGDSFVASADGESVTYCEQADCSDLVAVACTDGRVLAEDWSCVDPSFYAEPSQPAPSLGCATDSECETQAPTDNAVNGLCGSVITADSNCTYDASLQSGHGADSFIIGNGHVIMLTDGTAFPYEGSHLDQQ